MPELKVEFYMFILNTVNNFRAGIWVPARSLLGEVPGFEFWLTFSTIIRLIVWRFLIGLGNNN